MTTYLIKSRFALGLECPAKLHYIDRPKEYHSAAGDDPFMAGLAEGGYQVNEFAKWMLCDNPREDTIDALNKEAALAETRRRLTGAHATIAEAAFQHGDLFIRADVVVKDGKTLKLYEVKSKSWDDETLFWTKREPIHLNDDGKKYLLDVAFQKYVLERACPDFTVQAHLVLLDKGKCASVDGLCQMFPVFRQDSCLRVHPRIKSKAELGNNVLAYIDVDEDITRIHGLTFDLPQGGQGTLPQLIEELAAIHQSGKPFYCGIGAKCKKCQFRLPSETTEAADLMARGLKSGLDECWAQAVGREYDPAEPKVIELWNCRKTDGLVEVGKYYLKDVCAEDLGEGKLVGRQSLQLDKVRNRDNSPWIDTDGLSAEMSRWKFPLHFIDFETARMPLPVQRGMPPYMQVAFQFSHHTVDKAGTVRHAGQWIEPRPGVFPSFEFVRALKRNLENDEGTIFRYAPHENTVLRDIHGQLDISRESDRVELMSWIDSITEYKPAGAKQKEAKIAGPRNMVDMRALVIDYHYDPATHGSNSLKYVLPAIINSS